MSAFEAEIAAAAARDREPDLDLIKSKVETVFATLGPKAEQAALSRFDADVDRTILEFVGNDTGYFQELTKGKPLHDKINLLNTLAYQMGQRDGPGEDMVVMTKAEHEAAIQAAVRASQSSSPTRGASVGGGGSTPTSALTLAQIESMPYSEWHAKPLAERTKLLADAHARAAR